MTLERPNGGSVAALLAAAIGAFALGVVVLVTELSTVWKDRVFALGKAWIPGAAGIGPYSGKETVMLVAWLVAWGVLHAALRKREVDARAWAGLALALVFVATLLIWPPVWHWFGA